MSGPPRLDPTTRGESGSRVAMMMAGGGFASELLALHAQLSGSAQFYYFIPAAAWGLASSLDPARCIQVPSLVETRASGVSMSPLRWAGLLRHLRRSLSTMEPRAVICLGSVEGLPLIFAAKSLGIDVVFIESITRVLDLSLTGKIVYRLGLANRFYVQWPRLARAYGKADYGGVVIDLRDGRNDEV